MLTVADVTLTGMEATLVFIEERHISMWRLVLPTIYNPSLSANNKYPIWFGTCYSMDCRYVYIADIILNTSRYAAPGTSVSMARFFFLSQSSLGRQDSNY